MAINYYLYRFTSSYPMITQQVNVSSMENKFNDIANTFHRIVIRNTTLVIVCGTCIAPSHATYVCLVWEDDYPVQFSNVGGFHRPPQRRYDSFSDTYIHGWRDYPGSGYGMRHQSNSYNLVYPCDNHNP